MQYSILVDGMEDFMNFIISLQQIIICLQLISVLIFLFGFILFCIIKINMILHSFSLLFYINIYSHD